MKNSEFKYYSKGTLYNLLLNSYSSNSDLTNAYKSEWQKFDEFVFDNLNFMNNCGFITVINNQPIGFISWNPENLPENVEIGHNCIINEYKNRGYGKQQLSYALNLIKLLNPKSIVVKTGNIPFFEPAQKMYETVGFVKTDVIAKHGDDIVSEVVCYRLTF